MKKGNIPTKESGEVMVDEYKRARRDLQTIFFLLPNFFMICLGPDKKLIQKTYICPMTEKLSGEM